jgi:hypothetical protein
MLDLDLLRSVVSVVDTLVRRTARTAASLKGFTALWRGRRRSAIHEAIP